MNYPNCGVKLRPKLPWEEGEYGPCNTLLIDDSPYKALCNPVSVNLTLEHSIYGVKLWSYFFIYSVGMIY